MIVCLAREDLLFWCPLVGAESDSCGRNGRWKGFIFRHNKVHVQNQGAVLRKSSPRGVHPADFPARQGENERRSISSAHFTLDENGYPVVSPNDQRAPCCVVYPYKNKHDLILHTHPTITDIDSCLTYIGLPILPTAKTLYTTPPTVLLSCDT